MLALVLIVPLVLLVGAVLLPVAFLRSFGNRPWTAWGRGVLLALTGFCLASLTGLFTAGGLVMDAGDVCLRPLEDLGHSSSDPYPTLRTELFPFHAVCDDGRYSVDLVPGFVNPTLVACLLALPVLLVGLVAARRRTAAGAPVCTPLPPTTAGSAASTPTPQRAAADSPGPTPAPRMLSWVIAGLGLTALFLTLAAPPTAPAFMSAAPTSSPSEPYHSARNYTPAGPSAHLVVFLRGPDASSDTTLEVQARPEEPVGSASTTTSAAGASRWVLLCPTPRRPGCPPGGPDRTPRHW